MTTPGVELSWASLSSGMLFSLVIGGLVVLAAIAAHDAQRAANRAVRWVWFTGVLAIVVLTAASPLRRPAPSSFPRSAASFTIDPSNGTESTMRRSAPWWTSARSILTRPVNAAMSNTQTWLDQVPDAVHRSIGALWLIASVATLGVFIVSYWRVRRTLRHWPVQRIGDTEARIAPSAGPAVVGLAPSQIILPAWLLSRSAEEQRLVVTHESEHVRAGDPWLLVMACGAVALMPWHPALWYALSRLRLAVELDCDRRVLGRGIPTASYGALLIDLSALRSTLPSAMPAFSCSGSYLERRLVAMTARPSRFSATRRAVGAFIAAAAFVTACESKLPTSAEVDQMDVASAREQATKSSLIEERRAEYFVNGKKVSAAVAEEIAADRIASVEIVGKTAERAGQIRVATKGTLVEVPLDSATITFKRSAGRVDSAPGSGTIVAARTGSRIGVRGGFDGLIVIDGRIVEKAEMDRLSPDQIASIEVVKGPAATALYSDPRAANGVIKVTLKAK